METHPNGKRMGEETNGGIMGYQRSLSLASNGKNER